MKSRRYPFEFTPQIQRYLKELIYFNDEFYAQEWGEIATIKSYSGDEVPTYRTEESNQNFWKFLRGKGAIKITNDLAKKISVYECNGLSLATPSEYQVKILDIDLVKGVRQNADRISEKRTDRKSGSVEFQGRELRYGTIKHTFHRTTDLPTFSLFDALWKEKQRIINGKLDLPGKRLPAATVAVRIGLIDSVHNFEFRPEARNILKKAVKNLQGNLKKKGFPITIKDYLMIVEE